MVYIYHHINSGEEKIGELQKNKLESIFNFKFIYNKNVIPLIKNEWDTFFKIYLNRYEFKNDDIIFFLNSSISNTLWKKILEDELILNFNFYIDKIKKGYNTSGCCFGIPEYTEKFYGGFWYMRCDYLKTLEKKENWESNNMGESCFIGSGKNWNPYTNLILNYNNYPFLLSHLLNQFSEKVLI